MRGRDATELRALQPEVSNQNIMLKTPALESRLNTHAPSQGAGYEPLCAPLTKPVGSPEPIAEQHKNGVLRMAAHYFLGEVTRSELAETMKRTPIAHCHKNACSCRLPP